jgi:hypothetical protein
VAVYTPFLAGQRVTADGLNKLIVQELMPWTALASVGSFASGYTAGTPAPRMRKLLVLGVEVWEFEGRINIASLAAGTPVTAFTFSSGNRVATERGFQQFASNTGFYGIRVAFAAATGVMTVGVPSAAGSACSGFLLDEIIITNPLA